MRGEIDLRKHQLGEEVAIMREDSEMCIFQRAGHTQGAIARLETHNGFHLAMPPL